MNAYAKLAIAAAAVMVVAVVGYSLLPRAPGTGGQVTPNPTASPSPSVVPSQSPPPSRPPTLPPGTYRALPFGPSGFGLCPPPLVDPTCVEDPRDDTLTFTFEAPDSWSQLSPGDGVAIDEDLPPAGAAVFFTRGNWIFSNPCLPNDTVDPDVSAGTTVDDFVSALANHPLLDVTTPVEVTLAGYSGKYVDLRVPDDISECFRYRPIDTHIYAQGPSHQWHMWVLDVGGIRVVVEGNDYPGTPPARLAEEQAIIDSIVITE